MKKVIVPLLLLCLLCGCGGREDPPEPAVLTDTVPTTQAPSEDGLVYLEPETQPEPGTSAAFPVVPEELPYSVLESDDSIRNDNGDILVNIRYQRVILDSSQQPQWQKINDEILTDYHVFREETAYLQETSPQDWESMLQSMGAVQGNLMAVRNARVSNVSGGMLSICMQQDWFMGGVYNCDYYGLNFDLTTGEKLPLARLSNLPEQEFEAQLKGIVCQHLEKDRDVLFEDPAVVLESYSLEDLRFYLEEGELILTFPTYTFGPGALGSTVIKTGLYPEMG